MFARMLEGTNGQATVLNTESARWRSTDLRNDTKSEATTNDESAIGFGFGVPLSFH